MVTAVLVIGGMNLLLGFALAVYLERRGGVIVELPSAPAPSTPTQPSPTSHVPTAAAPTTAPAAAESKPAEPEPPPIEAIPAEWLDSLELAGAEAGSFVEASAQVLRLEVGRYREAMIELQEQVDRGRQSQDGGKLGMLVGQLRELNVDWLEKQTSAAGHFQQRKGNLGEFSDIGEDLETVLSEQAAQMQSALNDLDTIESLDDVNDTGGRLAALCCQLVDLAHNLRDRVQESALAIMRADDRLADLDRKFQVDAQTTLLNRMGFEVLLDQWWRDDPARQRTVSVAVVDVDRFAELNARRGARWGDAVLAQFGRLVDSMLRKERGFDRAARLSGQRFAVFFGDTGPRGANSGVERIRQTIEQTTFQLEDEDERLTASCAVTEIQDGDTSGALLQRLQQALRCAKQAGRNTTAIDEGQGPEIVSPPEFKVVPGTIAVEKS